MEKYTSLRESATIQMKAIEHFFSMEVLITLYKVYTFAGVFEWTLWYGHSNGNYLSNSTFVNLTFAFVDETSVHTAKGR